MNYLDGVCICGYEIQGEGYELQGGKCQSLLIDRYSTPNYGNI